MKRRLSIMALFLGLCAFPASAVLDTNENGLSDLWEMRYANGNFPNPGFDPLDDPDADGWTNAKEAAAGTNPFDANPPDGHLQPLITHIPAVWEDTDSDEIPDTITTPEAITLTWPTIAGKQYTLMVSPDLVEWLPVGEETFIGSGLDVEYGITLPENDKLFWRVKVADVDSDSDGLTDAEEAELGTSPDSAQTISGYPDMWLAKRYSATLLNGGISSVDPAGDPDQDGLTNAQEAALGTNPALPDNPGMVQDSIINGTFSDPEIGEGKRKEEDAENWKDDQKWDYFAGVPGWSAIEGQNIEYQIVEPVEDEEGNQYVELKAHPEGHYGIEQEVPTRIGVTYILTLDCKARQGTSLADNKFSVKKDGTSILPIAPSSTWSTYAVTFTADNPTTVISLVPDTGPEVVMGCLVDNVRLAPVVRGFTTNETDESVGTVDGLYVNEKTRVFIPDSNDLTGFRTESRAELKISQWDNVFEYANSQWQFSDTEFKENVDVFWLQLPMDIPPPPTGKHRFKVWTTNATGATVDEGAEVELTQNENCHQSDALCLVADETDDAFAVNGKADGELNDHTFRAELGGKVNLQWLTAAGANEIPILSIPVPVKRIVTAHGYILQEGSFTNSDVTTVENANACFEHARKILATCGVKLNYQVSVINPNPDGVSFGSFLGSEFDNPRWVENHVEIDPEPKALMNDNRCRPEANTIPVYFVGYFNGGSSGVTTVQSAMLAADAAYSNAVFLDAKVMTTSTLTHELMHVLLDAVHSGPNSLWSYWNTTPPWCIWYTGQFGVPELGILARKRVLETMRTRLLKSPFCKSPAS